MLGLLAAAALSAGGPIYLNCELDQDGESFPVEIFANETTQRATVLLPSTGRVVERLAIFSPNELRIVDEQNTWVVNRVSLDFERIVVISDTYIDRGTCEVAPQPADRAF